MDDENPKPPVRQSKTISKQSLERGERANLGGETSDRSRGRYSKDTPTKGEDEAFEGF